MYDEALLGTPSRPLAWRRIANYFTWDRMQLTIVFMLFVILRAMDRVFNKRVADRMADYQLMYVNVFWPAGVQLMTILMVGMYVGYQPHSLRFNLTQGNAETFDPILLLIEQRSFRILVAR